MTDHNENLPALRPMNGAATEALETNMKALADAKKALEAARAKASVARGALMHPTYGTNPVALLADAKTAEGEAADIEAILPALLMQQAEAFRLLTLAQGARYADRVEFAKNLRLVAANRIDAALAEIEAAKAQAAEGAAMIKAAFAAGMPAPAHWDLGVDMMVGVRVYSHEAERQPHRPHTAREELALWGDVA